MCICDWADGCGGFGILFCDGCGGDQCVCTCGGEMECQGYADCCGNDDAEFYDSEDHWPEDIEKANEPSNAKRLKQDDQM